MHDAWNGRLNARLEKLSGLRSQRLKPSTELSKFRLCIVIMIASPLRNDRVLTVVLNVPADGVLLLWI